MHPAAAASFLSILALSGAAVALQPSAQPAAAPGAARPADQPPAQPTAQPAQQVPPGMLLGLRVDGVRRKLAVAPVVVIVPDVTSYVEAIGMWRLTCRFPILIDDGTPQAREDIGRFVRAMKPEKVLRWETKNKKTLHERATDAKVVNTAVGKAWSEDGAAPEGGFDVPVLLARWKQLQLASPGIVIAAVDDPAWTAAAALAAGHGQPIFWTTSSRKLDNGQPQADADAFCKSVEAFCESTGLPWRGIGDAIDAVTICTSMPQTITGTSAGIMALTDRVGRLQAGSKDTERWAWAGQIPAQHAQAAYRAMCSLFLPGGRDAWVFDGYASGPGWDEYDAAPAAELLKKNGWNTKLIGKPGGTLAAWKAEASKPFAYNLIFVNTHGEKEQFHLQAGTARLGDLPILTRPAVVHFIHSFSAQYVGTRQTISGRWLERGVSGYIGSVDEPFLNGFMRPQMVAARFASQFPLGAAARYDSGQAWKITVLGDPLLTFGGTGPAAKIPAFDGAVDLSDAVKTTVRSDLPLAMWQLVMLGRDEDAAKLASALAKAGPDQFKADAALPGITALFRTGKTADLRALAARLKADDFKKHPEAADAADLAR